MNEMPAPRQSVAQLREKAGRHTLQKQEAALIRHASDLKSKACCGDRG
jgi:hypothetical protein